MSISYEEFIKIMKNENEMQIKMILMKKKNKLNCNVGLIAFLNYDEMLFVVGEYDEESIIAGSGGRLIEGYYNGTSFKNLNNAIQFFNENN